MTSGSDRRGFLLLLAATRPHHQQQQRRRPWRRVSPGRTGGSRAELWQEGAAAVPPRSQPSVKASASRVPWVLWQH